MPKMFETFEDAKWLADNKAYVFSNSNIHPMPFNGKYVVVQVVDFHLFFYCEKPITGFFEINL